MLAQGFRVLQREGHSRARVGELSTAHGVVQTPAFMPVGSQATVKGLSSDDLTGLGFEMVLCNAYHLYLRPGHQLIAELGGLHRFMGWSRSILTDSGGYQVFSLAPLCKVSDDGVTFQSHLDGSLHHLTPERVIEIQESLGADVAMTLDECLRYPAAEDAAEAALLRTTQWARRSRDARRGPTNCSSALSKGRIIRACGRGRPPRWWR